jgi:hypothetical protein
MDNVELAQESLEKAHGHEHAPGHAPVAWNRQAAILIAMLAALAVLVEMSGNDAQTEFLAHYVSAVDTWAQYQAKSTRRVVLSEAADIMASTAGAAGDPAIRSRIETARNAAARMQSDPGKDGMEQLRTRAVAEEKLRDHELHRHEGLERGARGLQIAVVLAGLSIVTGAFWLFAAAGLLGAASAVYALLAGLSLI